MGAWPDPRNTPVSYAELQVEDRDEIGRWKGTRVILSCPACHDAHSPSIKPYKTSPPPLPRKGLASRGKRENHHGPIWVRLKTSSEGH